MTYRTEVYQDDADEWRWRMRAANGEVVAVSGEGYTKREHAESMAARIRLDSDEQERT